MQASEPVAGPVLCCLPWPHHCMTCPTDTWHDTGTCSWTLQPSMPSQGLATTTTCLVPNHCTRKCPWGPQLPLKPLWIPSMLTKDNSVVNAVDPSGLSQRKPCHPHPTLGALHQHAPLWGQSLILPKSGHKVQVTTSKGYWNHKKKNRKTWLHQRNRVNLL